MRCPIISGALALCFPARATSIHVRSTPGTGGQFVLRRYARFEATGGDWSARNKQGARSVHYCEIPICFTTGCHNSCSLRMNSVVSAGDIGRAKVARSASFCLSSG
jgi:hypothetical protein